MQVKEKKMPFWQREPKFEFIEKWGAKGIGIALKEGQGTGKQH